MQGNILCSYNLIITIQYTFVYLLFDKLHLSNLLQCHLSSHLRIRIYCMFQWHPLKTNILFHSGRQRPCNPFSMLYCNKILLLYLRHVRLLNDRELLAQLPKTQFLSSIQVVHNLNTRKVERYGLNLNCNTKIIQYE